MTADECRAAILAAEKHAAEGIARDLQGLAGVHGDVIAFIESRWLRWLEAKTECIERAYYSALEDE